MLFSWLNPYSFCQIYVLLIFFSIRSIMNGIITHFGKQIKIFQLLRRWKLFLICYIYFNALSADFLRLRIEWIFILRRVEDEIIWNEAFFDLNLKIFELSFLKKPSYAKATFSLEVEDTIWMFPLQFLISHNLI